ncbi:hypothetical protein Q9L58_002859 [Maublancomyces gigas]|uniref:Cytochrome c oxidase assembly protein COX20, mitochondrial n=1 Tax=Discina gigas TaxID=1032678 RepID=A0ABR3GQI6_9PEZI
MADDTRGTSEPTAPAPTKKRTYTPTPPPVPSANEYARAPAATVTDAVRTIALDDFTAVHMQPCVRSSLLYGIGTGFAFGGLRLVLGASVPRAANWAAGTFAGASLVTYEFCQYRRSREKVGMQRAIEIIDRRKEERERQAKERRERAQERARKELEERTALEVAARRSWYRFW